MGIVLQILSYIFFGAVFLFGMLTYFKDHKMYPQYPKLFKLSLVGMVIVVTLQIFFSIKFPLSLFLWAFFAAVLICVQQIIKFISAKDIKAARNYKIGAIIFAVLALIVLIALGFISYKMTQAM